MGEQKATRSRDVKSPLDRARDSATDAREAAARHPVATAGIVAGVAVAVAGAAYGATRLAGRDGDAAKG